jgi:hypothetical protein
MRRMRFIPAVYPGILQPSRDPADSTTMDKTNVRRALGVLLIGVSLGAAACTSTTGGDVKVSTPVLQSFPDEAFTAEFPEGPRREEEKTTVAGVEVTMVMYSVGELAVGYVNYPTSLAGSLDGAVKGAADNINGTLQSRTDTTFMGHPATDIVIKSSDAVVHNRLVMRGQRL